MSSTKNKTSPPKKSALRSEVEKLHAEMEIADYGINEFTGRSRRKPTRKVQKARTIKRKFLEKEDVKKSAVTTTSSTKRLRGSKAAFEDEIVHGSLIFGGDEKKRNREDKNYDYDDDEEYVDDEHDGNQSDEAGRYELYQDDLNGMSDVDDENPMDNSDEDGDQDIDDEHDEVEEEIEGGEGDQNTDKGANKKRKRTGTKAITQMNPELVAKINEAKKLFPRKKIARTMYRLRNFKSHRMAEKHGDALGRHARGMNQSAVEKLKEVASAAPIAPQVYSSLGLVYESMLADEMKKCEKPNDESNGEDTNKDHHGECVKDGELNDSEEFKLLKEAKGTNSCIDLAEKTFGSYHVAALLCKLDYTLWLRAGDAAMKLADLHKRCLSLPAVLDDIDSGSDANTLNNDEKDEGVGSESNDKKESETSPRFLNSDEYMQHHRARRMKWLEEAKNDYLAADHINPPGISVPCKLAYSHIQLGNLSEALTILTDMKNNSLKTVTNESGGELRPRSELERSHSAWLLYADLMLTIGFECSKWNRGDETNNNYMFRRWLRKYSKTFDWKERRLQSLCLALEAAIGTKCCEKIVLWMQRRGTSSKKTDDTYELDQQREESSKGALKDTKERNEGDEEQTSTKVNSTLTKALSLDELLHTFNRQRENLLSRNCDELEKFDQKTADLNLENGSEMDQQRSQERNNLIKKHKSAIMNLAIQYSLDKDRIESSQEKANEERKVQPISLSASCTSVFDIASQLMKQCLGMEIYSLAVLVANSVSSYLKERTLRSASRKSNMRAFNQRQLAASSNILQLSKEVYDDLHEDGNKEASDSDSVDYLSDDDFFDNTEDDSLLDAMDKGVLPPELQVLHGTCLIGEGGSDFLAEQLIKAMKFLNEDQHDKNINFTGDDDIENNLPFVMFRGEMQDSLNKPSGFAFFTDFILKENKHIEWTERLLPIYEEYVSEIEGCQEVNILEINPASLSMEMSRKRNYYLKILLFLLQLRLNKAQKFHIGGNPRKAFDMVDNIYSTIHRYSTTLLQEIEKRELHEESIKTIKILRTSFQIMLKYITNSSIMNEEEELRKLHSKLRIIVCWICQVSIPNHEDKSVLPRLNISDEMWSNSTFPFSSEWQTEELKILSRRSFNLGVSCDVSCFSGWENAEFNLRLVRRDEGPSYFGAHLGETHITGYLLDEQEALLASQWKVIYQIIPTLPAVSFDENVACMKKEEWYKDAMLNLKNNFSDTIICRYGEDEALEIILIFSQLCLKLASLEQDHLKKSCLLANAMSIMLPLTQFCFDHQLWSSPIGTGALKNDTVSEWQHFAQNTDATIAPKPPCRQKPTSTKKAYPQEQFSASGQRTNKCKSTLMKLVKVPVEVLLREWNGESLNNDDEDIWYCKNTLNKWSQNISGPATIAMKRVDYTLNKLRQCSSITTLQKASFQVAMALLDLVATKECQNPFLCLQHAATFSSQSCKGGNNDEEFKKPLPEETECTPNQAIGIIGRADCLRAIHFIDEAIFICSFVARVCRLHRDKKSDLEWNSKWRVVAILMYTISVAIDSTIYSFMDGDAQTNALQSWSSTVKAEISRARSDAIALQKAFSRRSTNGNKHPSSLITTQLPAQNIDDFEADVVDDDNALANCQDEEDANDDSLEYHGDEEVDSNDLDEEYLSVEPPDLSGSASIPLEESLGIKYLEDNTVVDDDESLDEVAYVPI